MSEREIRDEKKDREKERDLCQVRRSRRFSRLPICPVVDKHVRLAMEDELFSIRKN